MKAINAMKVIARRYIEGNRKLKFRESWKKRNIRTGKQIYETLEDVPKVAPYYWSCEFCTDKHVPTHRQVSRSGRTKSHWQWICPECEKELKRIKKNMATTS